MVGDNELTSRVPGNCRQIYEASIEGLHPDGNMIYKRHSDGVADSDRHWWVQAEAVVGYVWQYKYANDEQALIKAFDCWEYIKQNIIDWQNGEWWWSCRADGGVNEQEDKAGFWKCPYHNSRMCFEVAEQFKEQIETIT